MRNDLHLAALANFASRVHPAEMPTEVLAKARLCLLDGIAAALATAIGGQSRTAISTLAGEPGETIVIGGGSASPGLAAFLNAATSAYAICNDTHLASATHPGMVVIPTLLAAAQAERAEGDALLAAIVAGYEAMIRTGSAVVTPELARRFRPTGIAGPIGAAAAAARICGLSPQQAASAIALAANTCGGLNEWARFGTEEHVFHAGLAARNGLLMAQLAKGGIVAAASTLEGPSGLLAAFDAAERADRLSDGLGRTFRILDVVHKPVPACVFVQVPAMLAAEVANRPGFDARSIDRLAITVSRQAAEFPGCDNPGPIRTPAAAQQSHQFSVAAVLARGKIDHRDWERPEAAGVDELCARSHVVIDAEAAGASGSGARLVVEMRDGSMLSASQPSFRGMKEDAVVARFLDLAGRFYGADTAAAIIETVRSIETSGSVRRLLELMASRGGS